MIAGGVAAALVIVTALFTLPAPDYASDAAAPFVVVASSATRGMTDSSNETERAARTPPLPESPAPSAAVAPATGPVAQKPAAAAQKLVSVTGVSPKSVSPKSAAPKAVAPKAAAPKTASGTLAPTTSKPRPKAVTKRGSACEQFVTAASWDEAFPACATEARAGNALAGRRLATMYLEGHGTSRNEQDATQWYMQAADNGDVEAMYQYGVSLERGRGVKKDQSAALRWYTRAGDVGLAAAQYALGQAYEHGRLNAPKSRSLALDWYRKAAAQNFSDAASKVRDLSN